MNAPVDSVCEIDRALGIWREMAGVIVTPRAYAVTMEQADARGDIIPMKKALAMLVMSYKFQVRNRVRPTDHRWEGWV